MHGEKRVALQGAEIGRDGGNCMIKELFFCEMGIIAYNSAVLQ